MTPETCPNCGAGVPRNAKACPECGADEQTGWSERADTDRLGIHDPDDFDHERFEREEFGRSSGPTLRGWWWWVAIAVLLALLAFWW